MKTAFFGGAERIEVREIEKPTPGDDQVLVKVSACAICGSDMLGHLGPERDFHRGGHELGGVVEEVGRNVTAFTPGDVVAGITSLRCGVCPECSRGDIPHCSRPRYAGHPGFSEYVCGQVECFIKCNGLSSDEVALAEPLTVSIDLLNDVELRFGGSVAILGAGPIGLMALRLCKLRGAGRIYAVDVSTATARLDTARELCADEVIEADTEDVEERVCASCFGGVDGIIITAKPSQVMPDAVAIAAKGATIAFCGVERGAPIALTFDVNQFHYRKLTLHGSDHNPNGRLFPQAVDLLRTKAIDADKIVTHRFPLADIAHAFDQVAHNKREVVKAVVIP